MVFENDDFSFIVLRVSKVILINIKKRKPKAIMFQDEDYEPVSFGSSWKTKRYVKI